MMTLDELPVNERTYVPANEVSQTLPSNTHPFLLWLSSISGRRFLCVMGVGTFLTVVIMTSNFGNQLINNKHFQTWLKSYFSSFVRQLTNVTVSSDDE